MIETRDRRRRDGTAYTVHRVRWLDETGAKRCRTFDREQDARDFDARIRLLRRSEELVQLDAGRQSLLEFAAEWWQLEACRNLEPATLRSYASH